MKIYVRSFAESKSQLRSDLRSVTKEVINHLIKIFLYPNAKEQRHWKQEVATFFNDMPKLKNSKKYPKADFLYENTWDVFKETTDNRIANIIDTMTEDPIETSYEDVYNAIQTYFLWICGELSKYGIVRNNDIYQKIEDIREIYFG